MTTPYEDEVVCWWCEGTGRRPEPFTDDDDPACPICDGRGTISRQQDEQDTEYPEDTDDAAERAKTQHALYGRL